MLTFDDGPWPVNTPAVLKALADDCLKATFFEIGEQAIWHPEIAKQVVVAGNTIGSHTWSHKDLARNPYASDIEQAKQEIEMGVSAVHAAVGGPQVAAGILLALILSANAVESAAERCERGSSVDAAIEACSSVIQTDNDRHRVAMAYFNRAGWHLKKDEISRAAADLSEAIGLEPDFAAALAKRGLLEERLNDLKSARADFAAVLKLPTTTNLSVWAHAMARERLAAT